MDIERLITISELILIGGIAQLHEQFLDCHLLRRKQSQPSYVGLTVLVLLQVKGVKVQVANDILVILVDYAHLLGLV